MRENKEKEIRERRKGKTGIKRERR